MDIAEEHGLYASGFTQLLEVWGAVDYMLGARKARFS
jgi:hypothetical protein